MAKVIFFNKSDGSGKLPAIFCPGCKNYHVFDERWIFNSDVDKPTFTPSMLVNQHRPETRCHSFVTDGKIQFLSDCFHELKNTIVDLEDEDE